MGRNRTVLVTGATGFIGKHLVKGLLEDGWPVRAVHRGDGPLPQSSLQGFEWVMAGDLAGEPAWGALLDGVSSVVHLAGLAHRLDEPALDAATYDRVNHLATRKLALAVAENPGVKKFVFLSTVAVHGSPNQWPLRADAPMNPETPYGESKLAGEQALVECFAGRPIRWSAFRPVLVYGPGNPGNMARLLGLIRRGVPVPVSSRENRRSFLYVGNLVSAILHYLNQPEPPTSKAWLISDEETCSTRQLVVGLSEAIGKRARVIRIPIGILHLGAKIGDGLRWCGIPFPWTSEVQRKFLGDFFVDSNAFRQDLGWTPPFTLEEGIRRSFKS